MACPRRRQWPRAFFAAALLTLPEANGRPNCTTARCNNAENICGGYTQPCTTAGRVPSGPDIWISTRVEYGTDFSFRRTESGSLSRASCEGGQPWLETIYEGRFRLQGGSPHVNGLSLASVEIMAVRIRLVNEQVCFSEPDGSQRCYSALMAVQALCPCNGWDWTNNGMPRERNIGMFCMPRSQCPLVHDVYLRQTSYLSYNATVTQACFSKASTDRDRGWTIPRDDACMQKDQPSTCLRGVLSSSSPEAALGPWRSAAGLASLAALAARAAWPSTAHRW